VVPGALALSMIRAQPQSQYQPGRAGADDQHVAAVHEPVLFAKWFKYGPQTQGGQADCSTEMAAIF
jgi:hypothetical protein